MSDLISREDAIEAFGLSEKTRKYGGDHSGYDMMLKYEIQDVLENLPSAELPKGELISRAEQGEWIDIDNYYRLATCSHCHKVTMFEKWGEYTKPYDYCPNCGAIMKGGAE